MFSQADRIDSRLGLSASLLTGSAIFLLSLLAIPFTADRAVYAPSFSGQGVASWLLYTVPLSLPTKESGPGHGKATGLQESTIGSGFFICLILSIAWGIVFGASALAVLLVIAFSFFMFAGLMRVGGEAWAHPQSWWYPNLSTESIAIVNPGYPDVPAVQNLASLAASNWGAVRSNDWNAAAPWGSPGGGWGDGIGVMRISQHLRGRLMEVIIVTAIGILLSSVVASVATEWYKSMYPYRYGETMTVSNGYGGGWNQVEEPWTSLSLRTRQWTYFAGGLVLWSVVMLLRMRFAWFIISPVGFMLPWTVHFFMVAQFGITIAWVLKLTALRVGGPKLVDKLQWLFIGAMVGLSMVSLYSLSVSLRSNWGKPTCSCGM